MGLRPLHSGWNGGIGASCLLSFKEEATVSKVRIHSWAVALGAPPFDQDMAGVDDARGALGAFVVDAG
jgi:hypothetical protein